MTGKRRDKRIPCRFSRSNTMRRSSQNSSSHYQNKSLLNHLKATVSGSGADQTLSGIGLLWPAVMVASSAFQAGASITKALFVFLLLPFLSNLKGIPFGSLLPYLKRWCRLLLKPLAKISGCKGAPVLPLLYIATILAFNISLLHLVKIFSAIVSSLTVMLSVPLSVYIMSKPLPYLPGGTSLSSNFMIGSIVLVLGLLLYNIPTSPTHTHTI